MKSLLMPAQRFGERQPSPYVSIRSRTLPEVSEPPPRGGKNVFDGFGQSWLDLLFVAATLTAAGCTNDVETINFLQVVAETL